MSQVTVKRYEASKLEGKDYTITEEQIIADATRIANSFKEEIECIPITSSMFPAARDLAPLADDLWRASSEGFELWVETFEAAVEQRGFSLSGDEGDGCVMWLHVADCKCFEEE